VTTVNRIVVLLTVATLLMFAVPSECKCVNRAIQIEGVIAGPSTGNFKIAVQVIPDPNQAQEAEIVINDHKFGGMAYFDSTKAEGRLKDNCSRVPEIVEVVLLKDGQEIDRIRLNISRDYVKDKIGDYKLRSPITLHSQ
jgi:hypothetical protein